MRIKSLGLLAAAVAGLLLSVSAAKANTIQSIQTSSGTLGSNFVYNFSIQITPNNGLSGTVDPNQSGLVILDFPGAISATLSKSGSDVTNTSDWGVGVATGGGLAGSGQALLNTSWVPSTFTMGGFLGGASFTDSATVNNIVLVYSGAGLAVVGAQTSLIHLQVISSTLLNTTLQSVSRNTTTSVANEVDSFPVAVSVPVPAAAWAGLSMLAGLGVLGVLRKRRA